MWFRSPPPLLVVTILSAALMVPLAAQQIPNPVLPGPSGTGDGLTRDALETPAAPQPSTNNAPQHVAARHTTRHRDTTVARTSKKTKSYATISRHRYRHRSKSRSHDALTASNNRTTPPRRTTLNRAPLVSFIYWWNGWVVRTFHTRSGTVLLDSIGAKS